MLLSATSSIVKLLNKGDDMSEYYAVQRSDEYLAHYGVKGMKWGVRKAVEKGNTKRLARHYKRAAKKLARLNAKADVNKQSVNASKYNKIAKIHGKVAAAGLGTMAAFSGAHKISRLAALAYNKKEADALNSRQNSTDWRAQALYKNASDYYREMGNEAWDVNDKLYQIRKYSGIPHIVGGLTVGAATSAAINKVRSVAAKHRTTTKGHAKAVAKRDAWKKEMQSAFKGTKYKDLPKVKSRSEQKANKYKNRAENNRKTAQEMRYWASKTPRSGEARSNYLKIAKKSDKKAARYERKYNRTRRKSK